MFFLSTCCYLILITDDVFTKGDRDGFLEGFTTNDYETAKKIVFKERKKEDAWAKERKEKEAREEEEKKAKEEDEKKAKEEDEKKAQEENEKSDGDGKEVKEEKEEDLNENTI